MVVDIGRIDVGELPSVDAPTVGLWLSRSTS